MRPKNIDKDSHRYWLTHAAALKLAAVARNKGIPVSALLEIVSDELAKKELLPSQLERISEEAAKIAERRQKAASFSE